MAAFVVDLLGLRQRDSRWRGLGRRAKEIDAIAGRIPCPPEKLSADCRYVVPRWEGLLVDRFWSGVCRVGSLMTRSKIQNGSLFSQLEMQL